MTIHPARVPPVRRSGSNPTRAGARAGLKPDPQPARRAGARPEPQVPDPRRPGPGASRKPAKHAEGDPSPRERVWQVIAAIPPGTVSTYGWLAALAGVPRGARFVGAVLRDLPAATTLPWHRVVNAAGSLSVDPVTARLQRERLESEGVAFLNGRIDLKRLGWGR